MIAARAGYASIVELLDPTDKDGVTALMRTAERGDVVVARALMTTQKKLRDSDGKTALMHAAQRGCKEAVRVLLEHEKGMKDNQSHSALYHALKTGHMETAKIVIPHEDPTDENDVTALMRAAARGDAEMVELLIPIQKEMKDTDGNTAFIHGLTNKCTNTALLLLESEAPSWTPLMCAAFTGDIETVRRHLSDKHKKNSDGETALIIAARVGHADVVELLDPTTDQGVTALMRAADRGDVDTVKGFTSLQTGRKAEYSEINGWKMYEGTALMRAAAHGHTEIVRLLVEYEGRIQDADGQTALMMAAYHGHLECAKLLLYKEKGMRDNKTGTALMYAAKGNHLELVELLADREAGMQDKYGYTALMIAVQNSNTDCVKVLAKKESHIKRTYNSGYSTCTETALDLAKKCNHEDKRDELIEILSEESHDK
ncbi:Ankyrin repeat protein [Giardia duodenalis]|uniref:Ankyrin repeat protein n=1 Tax=Giardia intestinalis TaxID=5741 RepID=V6TR36_GIAIN|nr:Ankyrin repeat protein [Giardia intestinalis]